MPTVEETINMHYVFQWSKNHVIESPQMGIKVEIVYPFCRRQLKCLWIVHISSLLLIWLEAKPSKMQSRSLNHCWRRGSEQTCLTYPMSRAGQSWVAIRFEFNLSVFSHFLHLKGWMFQSKRDDIKYAKWWKAKTYEQDYFMQQC